MFGVTEHQIDRQMAGLAAANPASARIAAAVEAVQSGVFSSNFDASLQALLDSIKSGNDDMFVAEDFESYMAAQDRIDELYKSEDLWTNMSITNCLNSGDFCRCTDQGV